MVWGFPVSAIRIFHRPGRRNVTHVERPLNGGYCMTEITGNPAFAGGIKLAAIMRRQLAAACGNGGMTSGTENIGSTVRFTMGSLIIILVPFVLPGVGMHRLGPLLINVVVTGNTVIRIVKGPGCKLLFFDDQLIGQWIISCKQRQCGNQYNQSNLY